MNQIVQNLEIIADNSLYLFSVFFLLSFINLFFPPTPLESVTLFAGYLTGAGHGSLIVVITATTMGMSLSSFIFYSLVKNKGLTFLERTPLKKLFSGKSFHRAMAWFKKYGIYTVFLGKLVPGMSLASVIGCGMYQWDGKMAALAFLGSNLIFYAALAYTGELLGAYWGRALPWLTKVSGIVILVIIAAAVLPPVFRGIVTRCKNKNPL